MPPPHGRWRARAAFARSLLAPRDDDLFPAVRARAKVRQELLETDAFLAFALEAIAATSGLDTPGLAVLSHPPGVSRRLRLRYQRPRTFAGKVGEQSFLVHADRRTARLLRRFASVGIFSEQHAAWARRHGIEAWYAAYPMPDLAGPDWRASRAAGKPNPRPRILMIGHLRGIGTISGLHLFVPEILPRLTEALGPDGFEVHLVGGHEPPERFRDALRHPAVQLHGRIDEPAEQFFRADVLLAPNPTTTGASARILSGLTFGCCIVAHTDSLVGIPELRDGENCLLAVDGPGLAEATLRALADPMLRDHLGDAGRELYERSFSPPVAARRIVRELEELASSSDR
jgi:glycosyltransferase involved in cell wall biosynthesis